MNRRDLLKRGFGLAASGLLLPIEEPIKRFWALDQTMLRRDYGPIQFWDSPWATFSFRADPLDRKIMRSVSFVYPDGTAVPGVEVMPGRWEARTPEGDMLHIQLRAESWIFS